MPNNSKSKGLATDSTPPAPNSSPKKSRPTSFWLAIVLSVLLGLSVLVNLFLLVTLIVSTISPVISAETEYREVFLMGENQATDKILLISVQGAIFSGGDASGLWGTSPNIVKEVQDALRLAANDPQIKALIFEINSPGGTVTACDQIHTDILRFKKKRPEVPIIVSMGDVAASGGYYIAVLANKIIARPTTITGSIGVIAHFLNIAELCKKIGIKEEAIKSGTYKDIGSSFRPMSDDERAKFQKIIDEMYERFIQIIAKSRKNLDVKQIRRLANGLIYTGKQALKNGLIDELGDLTDAVERAKEMAQLTQARVIVYREPQDFLQRLLSNTRQGTANPSALVKELIRETSTPRLLYMWKYNYATPD